MREGIFAHWPNRITLVRFLGSLLLFTILSIWGEARPEDVATWLRFAFFLFVFIAATDFLDGYLARRNHQVTAFGRRCWSPATMATARCSLPRASR
jgi:phosphatidylglycerophosphate synthase